MKIYLEDSGLFLNFDKIVGCELTKSSIHICSVKGGKASYSLTEKDMKKIKNVLCDFSKQKYFKKDICISCKSVLSEKTICKGYQKDTDFICPSGLEKYFCPDECENLKIIKFCKHCIKINNKSEIDK